MPAAREVRTAAQANQEDVFYGQTVIMWARWSVIVTGIVLVLWTSTNVSLLTQTMPFFLVLMAVNFFLHGRYVMGSPLNRVVVIVASVIDLVLITAIVVLWPGSHGLHNQFYVLYFPVVFAFALVFTRRIEAAYTVLAILLYLGACLFTGTVPFDLGSDDKVLVMRVIVIAAMGFLGNYYFRIQRDRLVQASRGDRSTLSEIRGGLAH
ncbi:MAG: hypothetical protein E6I27_11195 [Chloroflexi bacterium]|nr:MAG: hypothetical protein E6I96_10835 [Chloroflexota bacterium]TMF36940.1 MAG: hypothetical protein E6I27_11195 [Chloroflexota bacterium]